MKHILKHGKNDPKITDLDNHQMGISDDNRKLFIRIDDKLVLLNDYSQQPLGEEEVRKYAFTGDETGETILEEIALFDDKKLVLRRDGYKVSYVDIPYSVGEIISVMAIKGSFTRDTENKVVSLKTANTYNEFVIHFSNTYAIKLGLYKSTGDKNTVVVVENLVFSSEEEMSL